MYNLKKMLAILLTLMVIFGTFELSILKDASSDYSEQHNATNWEKRLHSLERSSHASFKLIGSLYCATLQYLPNGGFCLNPDNVFTGGNQQWDARLCGALENLFQWSHVGDFGAGLGHYGRCFLRLTEPLVVSRKREETFSMQESYTRQMQEANLLDKPQVIRSWKGFDGAANIDQVSRGQIQYANLASEIDLGERFDWVLSLEVGEHIPAANEDVFIDNLVRHACQGVVLSWAVLDQKGHGHVNERPNNYIRSKMAKRGMFKDIHEDLMLREAATLSWFKKTIMVFKFKEKRC